MNLLRALPAVDVLLTDESVSALIAEYGRPLVLDATRLILNEIRRNAAPNQSIPEKQELVERITDRLKTWLAPSLIPLINATGVILHTNLGRAPLSEAAQQAMLAAAGGYSSLEFDLTNGKRGLRSAHAERLLVKLTGAEAALVVNNNAAALMLALSALTRRKKVVISRTQLVEVGGSFRIPDVLSQSGARLMEIGATNRVHLSDYRQAVEDGAAAILHAHHSNFRISGFTSEPGLDELAELAKKSNVLLIEDLGSGALLNTEAYGLEHEPTVQEAVSGGADLVCFSGDKLLGGPQAGIIVGKKSLLQKLAHHPLARAVRADKLCLASLMATLLHYLKDEAEQKIPVWKMISTSPLQIKERAERWRCELGKGEVIEDFSTIGGGSLPGQNLPTFVLALTVKQPDRWLKDLRCLNVPIIARIDNERLLFDPRCVMEKEENILLSQLKELSF
ncbi:MAG: L-seryl-tRNA(Sec) selenium transferase [Anaerolineae bacterium]|nr:L-seryl-tRNA(Sec) selenium transferase [Anaerolineae bacterium]